MNIQEYKNYCKKTSKNSNYANRGMNFEKMINISNEQYAKKGIAYIQKIPTEIIPIRDNSGKVCNVKICGKSTVDYIGRFGKNPIAIEAKRTSKNRIPLKAVKEHQRKFLEDWTRNGDGLGYVFVSFQEKDFFLVPWSTWKGALIANTLKKQNKSDGIEKIPKELNYGNEFITSGLASFHKNELLEEWRVTMGQDGIVLPFLSTIIC